MALDGRWEWLGIALAGAAVYLLAPVFGHRSALGATAYGTAVLLILAVPAVRRLRDRDRCPDRGRGRGRVRT
ncbi:hypothetical protein ACFYNM_18150 [Streptomyces spororaveus]|uniref:hypothetical protein n=1 Tax=Streptomyces spororaveus TaxID=284039 RepID=UPI0036A9B3F3